MASKGKAIAGKDSPGKRKRGNDDKSGGHKRNNRGVLQFFEDSAVEFDGHDDSDSDDSFDDDDFLDDYTVDPKVKSEPGRFEQVPFFPKEEELSGDELERMLEERYRSRSGFVRYAEDDYDSKRFVDKNLMPSSVEPTIWKVKCKVGREKNTVFCLIQKYVDLKVLGTKLQIISAFAVEHIKGFVFVEAERQSDVAEACNQLADVYYSLVTHVPSNEVGQLLVVKKRYNEVKEGTWARVKNGIYRGDLAQVVAVNNERKRATVKLIPRIDLHALTEKYGGGSNLKRTKGSVPAARLINSSDLEEFRPLIQYRRDRDTGKMFEFLDSLMLKDGFLYKKVSIDSLSFWGVNPSEDELQKFTIPSNDESDNLEWLSQLYGEKKKKCNMKFDKGGGKGEGTSGSHGESGFEVHELVHFGKRDFGMVVGMEKDENYKILKDGSEGPVTLTLGHKDLKHVPLDKKFTALDHRMKTISINDTVRILDGPTKGRQGTVKQVYRSVIFLYDENDLDNAYFCTKSQMSEKVKHTEAACHGKDEGGPSSLEDAPSSPKSPLSPQKPWQMRGNNSDVDGMGKEGVFSVGQSLRIRVGPLKGYLCRVLAVRFSDITVKLDSQQKVLTVKRDHLSEVRGQSSASLMRDNPETSFQFKPFDLLGTDGNTNDWLQQASSSADGDGWNVGGFSSGRSAWPAFPSSGALLQTDTVATDVSSVDNNDSKEDTAWLSKVSVGNEKIVDTSAGGWEKAKVPGGDQGGSWNMGGCSSSQGKTDGICETDTWMQAKKVTSGTNSWGLQSTEKGQSESWEKGKRTEASCSSGWGKQDTCVKNATWVAGGESVEQSIGKLKGSSHQGADSWGKAAAGWGKTSNLSESSEWRSSAAASQSQAVAVAEIHTGWGASQGQNASGEWKKSLNDHPEKIQTSGTAAGDRAEDLNDKGSEIPCEDPWGKVVDKGDNGSNSKNEWGSSIKKSVSDGKGWGTSSGSWTNSQGENAEAGGMVSGGWKSSGDGGEGGSWGKTRDFGVDRASSFANAGGNDSWRQSKNFENDRGFSRGRGPIGRGRGRDQSGRGRGRSFDRGHFSSLNEDNRDSYSSENQGCQRGSSWGNTSVENDGSEGSWGKGKSWNGIQRDDNKSWNKSNETDKEGSDWSLEKSSPQTGSGPSGWGQKSWVKKEGLATEVASDNDQGSWGQGSGGGRGGREFRGGRNLFGRGGGARSAGQGQFSSGKNEGRGYSSWGNSSGRSNEGSSWSKGGQGTDEGREDRSWKNPGAGGSSWQGGNDDKTIGDKSSWSKGWSSGGGGENKEGNSWSKGGPTDEGREDRSWKKPGAGGSSWEGGNDNKTFGDKSSWSKGGRGTDEGREDRSWKNPGAGGSSWQGGNDDKAIGDKSSWSKGWSSGGGGENKEWRKPSEGDSSWGVRSDKNTSGNISQGKGWSSGGGEEQKGWKNSSEGGSSWGGGSDDKTSGDKSNWSKGLSSGGNGEDKGWRKPSEGGSWGCGSSDRTSGGSNAGFRASKGWGSSDGADQKGWSSGSNSQKSSWE